MIRWKGVLLALLAFLMAVGGVCNTPKVLSAESRVSGSQLSDAKQVARAEGWIVWYKPPQFNRYHGVGPFRDYETASRVCDEYLKKGWKAYVEPAP
jgi:hypothetical protein